MQAKIEQLIEQKQTWMASHITEAEFPTPLSEKGLQLYQSNQLDQSTQLVSSVPDSSPNTLTIYPVDCHPLTIRFSMILASQWQEESEQEAVLEYLTQIMLEEDSPARLFVGFFKGKPTVCGMIYQTDDALALVTDIHALPLANQQDLIDEMENYLLAEASSDNCQIAVSRPANHQ